MKEIADTGLIVAFLTRDDWFHPWAAESFPRHAPFYVCGAVLSEATSFFSSPLPVLELVTCGDLIVDPDFVLAAEMPRVLALASKYKDRPMDLADACLVRMTELTRSCKVWTVDRGDFAAYRRNGREPIACEFPPE